MTTSNVLKKLSWVTLGATLMTTGTLPVNAAVMFYTERSAFEATTTGLTTIDFEGIAAPGSFVQTLSPPGQSISGVTFADNSQNAQYIIDSGYSVGDLSYGYMGSDFLSATSPGSSTNITFSSPVTAVGTDIAGFALSETPFLFTLSTGNSFIYAPQEEDIGFIGFTSTTPIASLAISPLYADGDGPQLDNFTFGQAQPATITAPDDAFQIFFGEDSGLGQDTRLPNRPNADAARNSFLSNLVDVGTETFESFANEATPELTLNFSGTQTATLNGSGKVRSTPTGTNLGQYPISGNQYFGTCCGNFSIDFSQAISSFGFYGIDVGDGNGQMILKLENTLTGFSKLLEINNSASLDQPGGSVFYYGLMARDNFLFDRITFTNTAIGFDGFAIDDMTIGRIRQEEPTPVPAAPSVLAWVFGAIGMGLLHKRKQKVT